MALDLENDEAFSAAIKGLPKVTELIASVPKEKRFLAWCAARQSYVQTAQTLGFEENDAQEWASAVMTFVKSPTQPNGVSAQRAEGAGGRVIQKARSLFFQT
jgi:hypothetical protein